MVILGNLSIRELLTVRDELEYDLKVPFEYTWNHTTRAYHFTASKNIETYLLLKYGK